MHYRTWDELHASASGGGKDSKEAGGGIETDSCSPAGERRELDSIAGETAVHNKSASRRPPTRKKILK